MRRSPPSPILQQLAEQGVPGTVDLWPRIRAPLDADHPPRWRRRARSSRPLLAVVAAVALAFLLLGTALAGETPLRGMVQRFGLVLASPAAVATALAPPAGPAAAQPVPARPGATPRPAAPGQRETSARQFARVGLTEAQRQLAFPIRLPAWVPGGLALQGVFVFNADSVSLSYAPADGTRAGGGFGLEETRGPREGGDVVPAAQTQDLAVAGHPAVYAPGAADSGRLSWEADGFTYVLTHSGLGLRREDALRIAESLR